MTSAPYIYRTACFLICEYGDEADLVAALRADSLLEVGEVGDSAMCVAPSPEGDQGDLAGGSTRG